MVETNEKPSVCRKRKRRVGKRMIDFVGWYSKPLSEFLEAFGKDTEVKFTRHDVAGFINKYVNKNGLVMVEDKKKAHCDETIHAIFGRKFVYRKKVYDLLEDHFTENHDDSDSEFLDSSEEDEPRKMRSVVLINNSSRQMETVLKSSISSFAAVIPENIRLVYLKKSLVLELLMFCESFEDKIVGSFIRVRYDPNYIHQKNWFRLQLVTGIEKVPGADGIKTSLKIANHSRNVSICMLSDVNFSEEEVMDLRDRIKAGVLKQPTVDELQLKAQILHEDITKHSIAKELSSLQNKIDNANEKGWRRELFEYLDRRTMLQSPSEQEKLLEKVPEVIAEELEPESAAANASENASRSPKSVPGESSDVSGTDASGDRHVDVIKEETRTPDLVLEEGKTGEEKSHCTKTQENDPQEKAKPARGMPSDDEYIEEDEEDADDPFDSIWHYVDPQGETRGPFPLCVLKHWSNNKYFPSGFLVWRSGQTQREGVLLADLLRRTFTN